MKYDGDYKVSGGGVRTPLSASEIAERDTNNAQTHGYATPDGKPPKPAFTRMAEQQKEVDKRLRAPTEDQHAAAYAEWVKAFNEWKREFAAWQAKYGSKS